MQQIFNKKNIIIMLVAVILSAAMTELYTYLFSDIKDFYIVGTRFAIILFFTLIIGVIVSPDRKILIEFLYKYRWQTGVILILLGVILNVNGSSLAMWGNYLGYDGTEVVFGQPRAIRSDEWATFTPFAISQEYGNYSWYSNLIRGTRTDVTVIYAQPVLNIISIVFRPFLDGYLIFGSARGLAFFWCSRFVILWLVGFELTMIISDGRKRVSVLISTIIVCSPVIQWWFAINGQVEMLIFGGFAVIALDKYLKDISLKKRALYLAIMVWSAGGYLLTFYPALMVPIAYFYALIALWIIIKNRHDIKMSFKDVIEIIVAIAVFVICMGYFFGKTWDVVKAVFNTAYPGKRVSVGGGGFDHLFMTWGNLFFSYKEAGVPVNPCESALMFDMFPIGIILAVCGMIKSKKVDIFNILMLCGALFTGVYCFIGFPQIVAKLTFMSYSTSSRAIVAFGLCNIFLIARSVSLYKGEMKRVTVYLAAAGYALYVSVTEYIVYGGYISVKGAVLLAIISFVCMWMIFNIKKYQTTAVIVISIIVMAGGLHVNPVQHGLANVTSVKLAKTVQEVVAKDKDAVWAMDNISYPLTNYLIMQGAKTITSTNVYPNMELWHALDDNNQYEYIYNRYEHIVLNVIDCDDNSKETFELPSPDAIQINVDIDELSEKMNVRYVFTNRDLSGYKSDKYETKLVTAMSGYMIYEINDR